MPDIDKIPTADLITELEKRPDYCWYRGKEVRITSSDPRDSSPDRIEHYCHNSDERSAICEKNGGIGRCMTCIRKWNKEHSSGVAS